MLKRESTILAEKTQGQVISQAPKQQNPCITGCGTAEKFPVPRRHEENFTLNRPPPIDTNDIRYFRPVVRDTEDKFSG